MRRSVKAVTAFSFALLLGAPLGVTSSVSPARADARLELPDSNMRAVSEQPEPAPDPNRKKAGEACKSSDECQKHHTCAKVDGKNVCQAPPRPRLPPGAVT
jgi:hypothetical protein